MRLVFTLFAILLFAAQSAAPQTRAQGCYQFDRPLGHSYAGHLERDLPAWYMVELRDSGVVARPGLSRHHQEMFARRSSWTMSNDSVFFTTSTGLVGWKVTLVRADSVFVGRALYLTDVIVPGEGPLYVDVRARRVECPVRTDVPTPK